MLKIQPPTSETQTPPPTPQEIAQAIAAIEERKHSPASSNAVQTSTVSEVIDHLGLDMTAEDILAEVQACRAMPKHRASLPLPLKKLLASIVAISILVFFRSVWVGLEPDWQPEPAPVVSPASARPAFIPLPTTINPSDVLGTLPPAQGAAKGQPVHALADIANGKPFGASTETVQDLLLHQPISQMMLYDAERDMTYGTRNKASYDDHTSPSQPKFGPLAMSSWTLIKHNGKVYLRGWIVPAAKQHPLEDKLLPVFNGQNSGSNTGRLLPITLPLASSHVQGLYSRPDGYSYLNPEIQSAQQILVRGLPQDPHLWEHW